MSSVFGTPYLIELLTPRQDDEGFEAKLEAFGERYRRILDAGAVVSIPDNPMGNIHFTALEFMHFLSLPMDPERTLLHLNTFHQKGEVDGFLRVAADCGLRHVLVITGDGGPRLPRLEPSDIGSEEKAATSVGLLRYIAREFPGVFNCGVAYNQYDPPERERERLQRKLGAGARCVITQPVLGADPVVASLRDFGIPTFIGAWMSKRIDLLMACVGLEPRADEQYDPVANLALLDRTFPDYGLYLALLSFKRDWSDLLTRPQPDAAGR